MAGPDRSATQIERVIDKNPADNSDNGPGYTGIAQYDADYVIVTTPSIWALRLLSPTGEHYPVSKLAKDSDILPKKYCFSLRDNALKDHDQRAVASVAISSETDEDTLKLWDKFNRFFGPTRSGVALDFPEGRDEILERLGFHQGLVFDPIAEHLLFDMGSDVHLLSWQNRRFNPKMRTGHDFDTGENVATFITGDEKHQKPVPPLAFTFHSTDDYVERGGQKRLGKKEIHDSATNEIFGKRAVKAVEQLVELMRLADDEKETGKPAFKTIKMKSVAWKYSQVKHNRNAPEPSNEV